MTAKFGTVDTFSPVRALLVGDCPVVSRQITLLAGENRPRGAVLGLETASSKYKLSVAAAADGSEAPKVILAEDCDATSGDKATVAYVVVTVDENALTYGAGHSAATCREPLRDIGIYLQSSIG